MKDRPKDTESKLESPKEHLNSERQAILFSSIIHQYGFLLEELLHAINHYVFPRFRLPHSSNITLAIDGSPILDSNPGEYAYQRAAGARLFCVTERTDCV